MSGGAIFLLAVFGIVVIGVIGRIIADKKAKNKQS